MELPNVQSISVGNQSPLTNTHKISSVGEAEISFFDLLDVINPLQHIPIVSDIYQAVTGDKTSSLANIVGGFLFGGPVGAGMAIANEILDAEPAAGADTSDIQLASTQQAVQKYTKIRVTTEDWLNPNWQQENQPNKSISV